jgi:hypothetical protein
MALLALNIDHRFDRSGTRLPAPPLRLSFPKVNRASFPARALVFSLCAHALLISWILFGPGLLGAPETSQATMQPDDLSAASHVIYLPRLGGGSEGNGYSGGGSVIRRKGSATIPTQGTPGISYPGPQAILSDPPQPTNKFQTILRPALKKPPILRDFVAAPNAVQMTNAELPVLDQEQPAIPRPLPTQLLAPNAPWRPDAKTSVAAPSILSATNEQPKLALPTTGPQPPAPPATNMKVPKAASSRTETSAPQYSPVPTSGPDLQNLVSLSPNPAPPTPSPQLPVGEARGRFAISPDSNATSAAVDAGSKARNPIPGLTAIGSEALAPPGNAAGQDQAGVSNGADRLAIGGTGGIGTNTGNKTGAGNGGAGTDKGRGSAVAGTGLGSGAGVSPGAGSGAGVAEGSGSFPGITIGGNSESNAGGILNSRLAPQMVYSVPAAVVLKLRRSAIVVSTGSIGGGGLDAYGVLNCGKIYTIFLPMPGTNWTMQYCLKTDAAAPQPAADPRSTVIHIQSPVVPPDPDIESRFDFQRLPVPPEKAHKLIVLKGVLRDDGTVDGLQVYQGIVPQMDEAARIAFSKWKFKPAMQDGKPVSVQILIGVPPDITVGDHR